MSETYVYCRVTGSGEGQLDAMREVRVSERNIFVDRIPGSKDGWIQYRRLVRALKAGDLLYLWSFEALGETNAGVREKWRTLIKEKAIDIVVLSSPKLDTPKPAFYHRAKRFREETEAADVPDGGKH